uniref:YspA cpYpsA-related SLOG domain-containing protein n=1 Tax=viral metagenome TaxID=1070528 RepID=A0A6C0JSY8_9ZZZZ
MFYVGIVGSRNGADYKWFKKQVKSQLREWDIPLEDITIVSGGAPGIDSLAEQFAKEKDVPIIIFPANWDKYKLAAGPIRNTKIVNKITHLIAFPDPIKSIGTYGTIRKAKTKPNILVKIIKIIR